MLTAFEQVGGAQASLEMASDYALERYAFGRPIGSFQAIKHKLADVYVAIELASSNAYYGAWALAARRAELPVAAAAARVSANDAFHLAAKENIQTHGGMGFTWEFDCHLYYRRAKLLALALGSARLLEGSPDHRAGTANAPVVRRATMDFNDTPEEAAFRAERARFLEKNAKRARARRRHESIAPATRPRRSRAGEGLAGEEGRRRLCRHHLAEGMGRARRHRRSSR